MTASIKVLFQRYIWHKRFRSQDELLVVEP
jgi:hypothetical protein